MPARPAKGCFWRSHQRKRRGRQFVASPCQLRSNRVGSSVGCHIPWLRVVHIDFENGHRRVMGKGAKERGVPLGRSARRALRRTLLARGRLTPNAALFVADRGGPLTASGVQKIVRRAAQRAGLEVRCSPHVLRHTFTRSFLANGGHVFSLQRILGHSPASLDIPRRYVELL